MTDCFQKAINQCQLNKSTDAGPQQGMIFLVEAALGEMHRAYQPEAFRGAPQNSHSVYGVGQKKPSIEGLKDLNNEEGDFSLNEATIQTPQPLFFNTGKLATNPELADGPKHDEGMNDLKFNEFVVYDNAQVRLRYAVQCEFYFK